MRAVRVLFRRKSQRLGPTLSVKVVTNCRVPERKQPVQIHLGYLLLMVDGGIPSGRRSKLLKSLKRRWLQYFKTEEVEIDWADAERKLELLRARLRPTLQTASDPLGKDPGGGDSRGNDLGGNDLTHDEADEDPPVRNTQGEQRAG